MTIKINGITRKFNKNLTILQACLEVGEIIPSFCYHEKLHIAGNCRMCLVEVAKMPKPVSACTLTITPNMEIFTKSALVKKAQENVMESLLYLHPLDCPICDQAGECDLQEQNKTYGSDLGRYYKGRRGVFDKNCGPLIKTVMTRCIHCTRCVRFSDEIAGIPFFGTLKRGTYTEIAPFKNKFFKSELSGNVIDLCPVGALTAKPYAFQYRSWEKTNEIYTFDIFDNFFSNILIESTDTNVIRILPRIDNENNKEWISDRIRFSYDAWNFSKISNIYKLEKKNKYLEIDWSIFQKNMKNIIKKNTHISFDFDELMVDNLFYKYLNIYSLFLPKEKKKLYIKKKLKYGLNQNFFNDFRFFYNCNINMTELKKQEILVLLNLPLKKKNPLLNSFIMQLYRQGTLQIFSFGPNMDYLYNITHLGNNFKNFYNFLMGRHFYSKFFIKKNKISFLFSSELNSFFYLNNFKLSISYFIKKIQKIYPNKNIKFNEINIKANEYVLKENIESLNLLNSKYSLDFLSYTNSLSFKTKKWWNFKKYQKNLKKNPLNLNFNFNNEENKFFFNFFEKQYNFYFGSQGETNIFKNDYILPLSSFFEKKNLEVIDNFGNYKTSFGKNDTNNSSFSEFYYFLFFNNYIFEKKTKNKILPSTSKKIKNIKLNNKRPELNIKVLKMFQYKLKTNIMNSELKTIYKNNHIVRLSKNLQKASLMFKTTPNINKQKKKQQYFI